MANFNFNKAIIGGRLTADPELKQTQSGISITMATVAISSGKGDKQRTDFINIVAWRQTAEFLCKYFRKGSCICVTGHIQTRQYSDRDGNKRTATEILAEELTFVDSKAEAPQAAQNEAHANQYAPRTAGQNVAPQATDYDDDELPF